MSTFIKIFSHVVMIRRPSKVRNIVCWFIMFYLISTSWIYTLKLLCKIVLFRQTHIKLVIESGAAVSAWYYCASLINRIAASVNNIDSNQRSSWNCCPMFTTSDPRPCHPEYAHRFTNSVIQVHVTTEPFSRNH